MSAPVTGGAGEPIDYCQVPAGTYLCQVAEVRTGTTRAGDVRWSFRLTVVGGASAGYHAAWDSIVLSTRGRGRARQVLEALGLPGAGRLTVEPGDVQGRTAQVEVRAVELDAPNGSRIRRNEVPYDGWRRAEPLTGGEA